MSFLHPGIDGGGVGYLLRDEFTTAESAPLSTPRTSEPGPGTLTMTENSGAALDIVSGELVTTGPTLADWGKCAFDIGTAVVRTAGRMLLTELKMAGGIGILSVGFNDLGSLEAGSANCPAVFYWASNTTKIHGGDIVDQVQVGDWTADTFYKLALIQRATGWHWMAKGGTEFPSWTLLWSQATGTTTNLYPQLVQHAGTPRVATVKYFNVPEPAWVPVPLASDSFNRANSSTLGSTDGAGAEESGGSGLVWTDIVGNCEIVSNAFTTNGPGNDSSTVDTGEADVIIQFDSDDRNVSIVIRGNGAADDYWYCNIDSGGNTSIVEVLSGTPTTRASATPGIASGAVKLLAVADDEDITFYVDGGDRLTYGSAAAYKTATSHGIRLGSSVPNIDNFVVWPRKPSTPSWMG